jgi:hypothetical protein
MNTVDRKIPEVALIKANTAPVDDWNIYWLISKKQIEYLLTDIAGLPPSAEQPDLQRAQYQEEFLPVLSLEKYYGLEEPSPVSGYRYIVTKSPALQGEISRAIVRFAHPVRVRKLTFEAVPAQYTGLKKNEDTILGAYTLPDNQLVIIPDLAAVVGKPR